MMVPQKTPLVAAALLTVLWSAAPALATFDTTFSDPAGDAFSLGSPPASWVDAADIRQVTSATVPGNLIRITIVVGGTFAQAIADGASLDFSTFIVTVHGGDGGASVTLNAFGANGFYYDYSPSGGSGSGLLFPTLSASTLVIDLPIAWGGDEPTYSLALASYITDGNTTSARTAVDSATQSGGPLNGPPAITGMPPWTVNVPVGTPYAFDFEAVDPDGDTLTWSVVSSGAWGWVDIDGNGVLTGTPPTAGTYAVTVTVSDPLGASDSYAFQIIASGSCGGNSPPVITNAPSGTQHVSSGGVWTYGFSATDADLDTLTWDVSGSLFAAIDDDTGFMTFAGAGSGSYALVVSVTDGCSTTSDTIQVQVGGGGPGNDHDGDGIPDSSDPDDDNDGVPDASDPDPFNPAVPGSGFGPIGASPVWVLSLLALALVLIVTVVIVLVYAGTRRRGQTPTPQAMPPAFAAPPPAAPHGMPWIPPAPGQAQATIVAPAAPAGESTEVRLARLKSLKDRGLLTEEEYVARRDDALRGL